MRPSSPSRPEGVPECARAHTIADVAKRHESLKPVKGRLRMSFRFLRFTPQGILKSIGPSADGTSIELVLIQGRIHAKTYTFPADAGTTCWIWNPGEETQMAQAA